MSFWKGSPGHQARSAIGQRGVYLIFDLFWEPKCLKNHRVLKKTVFLKGCPEHLAKSGIGQRGGVHDILPVLGADMFKKPLFFKENKCF